MIKAIRDVERAIGTGINTRYIGENNTITARKASCLPDSLKKGNVFAKNIEAKRPRAGVSLMILDIIGNKLPEIIKKIDD